MGTRKTVRIGVFMPSECQLLDTACIDVFSMMGYGYLSVIPFLPKHVSELAPEVWIAYVGTTAPGTLTPLTAGVKTPITHHLSDPEVAPGKLDIVLVPGPAPDGKWSEDVLDWLRAQMAIKTTDCLSVCTGIYLFGEAGLLKGKKACGPRGLQDDVSKKYPDVTLLGHELRWIQDGNFWSSGMFLLTLPLHSMSTSHGNMAMLAGHGPLTFVQESN